MNITENTPRVLFASQYLGQDFAYQYTLGDYSEAVEVNLLR